MKYFFSTLFFFVAVTATAQKYQPSKIDPKAVVLYNSAIQKLTDGAIKEAVPVLIKTIAADTNYVDAILSLAGAYGELKDYERAVRYYQKARSKDTTYFKVYNLPYSIDLAGLGRFEEALDAVNIFIKVPDISEKGVKSGAYRKHCYEFAINYKQKHTHDNYSFNPINLGDSVNSDKSEYYPSLTIDDSLLVFTRRQGEGAREDFMESDFTKGHYSKAKVINGDINTLPYKGAINVSADGEWMIFAGNFQGGFGNFDLYISYQTPQGWSEPENLGPNINSSFWESSPSLSPDKRVLYFSSDRPGGMGGKDLYMSTRNMNGKWGPAVNMGPFINSAGDEMAPYIHPDNQTLYYTSDGLPGYGGTDLFILRKNQQGEWGAPENFGYPINTIVNEGSLAASANGLTAYYASDRSDSRGGLDLYKFDLPENLRPHRTLYVKGKVFDARTNKGLPCAVELVDNSNNKALMRIQTDELGSYFIPLPSGKDYTFTVNRKGYFPYSESYPLSRSRSDSTYQKNIPLQPIELNATFTLQNIQFASNSYQLLPDNLIELDKLLQALNDNPTLKVQIAGYTDNVGKEEDNLDLSNNRARAVAYYLSWKGIDGGRLSYKGYGSSKPVADNTTEAGRARNRRTEFVITGL